MKTILTFILCILIAGPLFCQKEVNIQSTKEILETAILLPMPVIDGNVSVEESLNKRRSVRKYSEESLLLSELSQILWAAQGITWRIDTIPSYWRGEEWLGGGRTAPSAGALYPIELYIAVGNVIDLTQGLYKYIPQEHSIIKVIDGDKRDDISNAALRQGAITKGAVCIVISAVVQRTKFKYGNRAERYVYIESGAVCQNIYLQTTAMGLGTVFIGAFKDDPMKVTLSMPENEIPIGLMPIGKAIKNED